MLKKVKFGLSEVLKFSMMPVQSAGKKRHHTRSIIKYTVIDYLHNTHIHQEWPKMAVRPSVCHTLVCDQTAEHISNVRYFWILWFYSTLHFWN